METQTIEKPKAYGLHVLLSFLFMVYLFACIASFIYPIAKYCIMWLKHGEAEMMKVYDLVSKDWLLHFFDNTEWIGLKGIIAMVLISPLPAVSLSMLLLLFLGTFVADRCMK